MKYSFSDQYKHPNWQKKRLEIFKRDGFLCQHCEIGDKTLQVHHRKYERGKKIWECADDCYVTLCEECHKEVTDLIDQIRWNTEDCFSVALMQTVLKVVEIPNSIFVCDIISLLAENPKMVMPVFELLNTIRKQEVQK